MFEPTKVTGESKLGLKQELFSWALGELLSFGHSLDGVSFRCGDLWRPDQRGHRPGSMHYEKLAIDVTLVVHGQIIEAWDQAPVVWGELGEFWEKLHPLCRWGGRFADYGHFSITHEGRM